MNSALTYEVIPDLPKKGQITYAKTEGVCNFPEHWHEHIELLYAVRGTGTVLCGDQTYRLEAGDLCIVNSNTIHAGRGCSEDYLYLHIIYSNQLFDLFGSQTLFSPLIRQDAEVIRHFESIQELYGIDSPQAKFSIYSVCFSLVSYLIANNGVQISQKDYHYRLMNQGRLNQVITYIQMHLCDRLTNPFLADLIHVNSCYFCHIFKELYGKTPTEYIKEARLALAKELLASTSLSVSDIALRCGMEMNYFCRSFRMSTGASALEYRKQQADSWSK